MYVGTNEKIWVPLKQLINSQVGKGEHKERGGESITSVIKLRRQAEINLTEQEDNLQQRTPPNSPTSPILAAPASVLAIPSPQQTSSRQKKRGRKLVRKDRSAAYRKLAKVEQELANEKKRCEKYRKQAIRARAAARNPSTVSTPQNDTPRKKARKFVEQSSAEKIEQELTFQYSVSNKVKDAYRECKKERVEKVDRLFRRS